MCYTGFKQNVFKGGIVFNNYFEIDVGVLSKEVIKTQMLFLRHQGKKMREKLIPMIVASEKPVVALDFINVVGIDFSCSDEIVVHFQENPLERKNKGLLLINLSQNHIENITIALDRKKQAVWYYNGKYSILLGNKLPKHLTELALVIKDKKELTARQLADELNEEINSQSTKLKKLYDHGLVLRVEDKSSEGSQFIYYSIV